MSDRIDPRRQTREIREALGRFEPEQLLEILTHVFRQYVIDGGAPPAIQLQDELSGLGFAQVIERLQLRLDLPELRLFEIQGGRVMVRVDGRLHPLETAESRPEPLPVQRVVSVQPMPAPAPAPVAAPPAPAAAPEPRDSAAPGAYAVGHATGTRAPTTPTRPATPAVAPATAQAPAQAPARPAAARPTAAPAAQPAPSAAPPAPAKAQVEKPESPGGRFGLLEID